MDIITQGLLGAVAAQAATRPIHKEKIHIITMVGFLAGLLADADIFIRSSSDPLLTLEFHRQFTHSILFIPFGGLLAAMGLWLLYFRDRLPFKQLVLFSTVAYATSGILDACTSYGTQLLWPFTDLRIAWNLVSVVDPLFSLILYLGLRRSWKREGQRNANRPARVVLVLAICYLCFGWFQQNRAMVFMEALAHSRGHIIEKHTVKPTMGNMILWRSIYQADGQFHVDAVRVSLSGEIKLYPGLSVAIFDETVTLPHVKPDSVLSYDIQRFRHFSDGYIATAPDDDLMISDVRYSLLPNRLDPLWGIRINPDHPDQRVAFENVRNMSPALMKQFMAMIRGFD
ncbi:MAG: metal-dependent hydrolase [Magnetococcales bacterium]|nr:metal-dependent hydrolase [Magnetococcales bacterium]